MGGYHRVVRSQFIPGEIGLYSQNVNDEPGNHIALQYYFIIIERLIQKIILKIYLEESGDLGFSQKSSDFFVIGAIIASDDICPGRCFKKARDTLGKKKKDIPELKCSNTNPTIKRRIYTCLSTCEIEFGYVVLRKYQVYERLKKEKTILYNYLMGSLVLKIIDYYRICETVEIIVDKSQYDFSRAHFDDYLTGKLLYNGMDEVFDDNLLQITHVDSRKCQGVHPADFLTGRVFRKYRDDNSDDYNTYFKEKTIVALDFFNGRIK